MDALSDLLSLVASNIWLYGGSFILVLSILVVVHEWGHFAVARLCGVRIDEFSVGFGRELVGYTAKKSGTRWKICLLPVGGYVKMFGDADPASSGQTDEVAGADGTSPRKMTDDERSQAFFSKSVAQRSAIVFAGPAINFLFAILLLAGLFVAQGKEITPPVASAVHVGGAGELGGVRPGDRILAIDGKPIDNFDQLRRSVMLALDTPLALKVARGNETLDLTVTPKRIEMQDRFGFKHERGYLGVFGPTNGFDLSTISKVAGEDTGGDADKTRALLIDHLGKGAFVITVKGKDDVDDVLVNPTPDMNADLKDPSAKNYDALIPTQAQIHEYKKFGLFGAVREAVGETWQITKDSLYALGQMVTGVRSASELGGVIRIGALAGDMANEGLMALITFTALLSINLGLINLFPIPMLDGGHLVFYALEALRGRPVPDRIQDYAFRAGLAVLVLMMAFANLNDLFQIFMS